MQCTGRALYSRVRRAGFRRVKLHRGLKEFIMLQAPCCLRSCTAMLACLVWRVSQLATAPPALQRTFLLTIFVLMAITKDLWQVP